MQNVTYYQAHSIGFQPLDIFYSKVKKWQITSTAWLNQRTWQLPLAARTWQIHVGLSPKLILNVHKTKDNESKKTSQSLRIQGSPRNFAVSNNIWLSFLFCFFLKEQLTSVQVKGRERFTRSSYLIWRTNKDLEVQYWHRGETPKAAGNRSQMVKYSN